MSRLLRPSSARFLLPALLAALVLPLPVTTAASAATTPAAEAATAAASRTTTNRARAAAGWLASRLTGGTHLQSCYNGTCFADPGLTADAVIGMASTGSAGAATARATTWLANHAADYIGATDGTGPYPGSYAKLALVAEVSGRNPTSFGGVDLLARLRAMQCPHAGCAAGEAGLFRNRHDGGGFASVITQSLSIVALSRSPRISDRAAIPAAVRFLQRQTCGPASGFQNAFPASGSCAPEVDATALAVQALLAAHGTPTGAIRWLARQQRPSGGFVGNGTVNANSTGLAVEALSAAGRSTVAARRYLVSLQLGCRAAPANRGAISYDGVARFQVATALRATPQAVLGLTGVPLGKISASGARLAALRLACAA